MTPYYLGADVGGTKTHLLLVTEEGRLAGFGEAGPGNHEVVGYEGLSAALTQALEQALGMAGIESSQIAGAGFGVAGFDWPDQEAPTRNAIQTLKLSCPVGLVNDSALGLLAGSDEGWGVAVVSGTGCNCWGWDRTRQRIGRVTGGGLMMGENAGATELMFEAMRAVAHEWTRRGPATRLSDLFVKRAGARNLEDLLEGLMMGQYELDASAAPLVFQAANNGDAVALDLVDWAGRELGELACAVVRQLNFQDETFDVVLLGSMFTNGSDLTTPMRRVLHALAPGARLTRLTVPPAVGAVLLGFNQAGIYPGAQMRAAVAESMNTHRKAAL